ncbi:MAG TPA: carbohydrate ABC transporter permease [Lachnospiraceae bacterium]|nr:carbohydrate ABC transporter permease [Lachnospiraceae bacterium]
MKTKMAVVSHRKGNMISKPADAVINIILMLLSLICILPCILVFIISITDEAVIIKNGYSFFPEKFAVLAYEYLLKPEGGIFRAYMVTIFVTVFGTCLSLIVVSMLAYALYRTDFKYRRVISFLVFFTMLFSGGMVPWYLVCTQILHLKNTIWALILPMVMSSWNVILMRTFFSSMIPMALIDAAKIDGCSEIRTWWSIVLPLAKPAMGTIALFTALQYWNDWYLPLMLIDDKKLYNLQYLLQKIQLNITMMASLASQSGGKLDTEIHALPSEGIRMAMCIFVIGPIVLAYPFFQRYLVKGITIGSVKG